MTIREFWTYPVKSLAGYSSQRTFAYQRGLEHDRRWMLVDETGTFISQRKYPMLSRIQARVEGGDLLFTHLDSGEMMRVENAQSLQGAIIPVSVWEDNFSAQLIETPTDFGDFLGLPARLVYMGPQQQRFLKPKYGRPGETVSFADGYPYLIANMASLEVLSQRVGEPLDMLRFRPNIVLAGLPAFAEDELSTLEVPGGHFRFIKPCARCVMITIDPETGKKNREVLTELAAFRTEGSKILFGMNAGWVGPEGVELLV